MKKFLVYLSIIQILFFSIINISFVNALDVIYRFFPTIDDKNSIVSIQPSPEWLWKYEIIVNNSQYENLPRFERMLLEIWKKQPDGSYENIDNLVYNKNQIKDEGIVWSFSEELNYLWNPIIEGDTIKKEYVTFKKIEIPYYKGDKLQKTYFDVSFKSMNIIHKKSSDWKVYPIKITKKNYNKATEVKLVLDKPVSSGKNWYYKYYVNIDTDKLPYEIRQLLAKRQFNKLYIRDSKQNYYNFVVLNKYQFWLKYDTDSPSGYPDDPAKKNFINLWSGYYYFSDLWQWTPTQKDIETMVNACYDKGGVLDSGSAEAYVVDWQISIPLWQKYLWWKKNDQLEDIAIDNEWNIYAVWKESSQSNWRHDWWIVKLDKNWNVLWQKHLWWQCDDRLEDIEIKNE